ncbi:HK97 family phage prohead protease [Clostridium sp.]|uniref:HK97 family phage prohead protease n=1 Tax=Clostridium sp. TaxID=1506 RepID=UPI0026370CE8|nr:HK97 family phage prohead protease [Clostridium sp.]
MNKGNLEFRKVDKFELREQQAQNNSNMVEIDGYIAKFNSVTELFEGFYENIDPHAFDNTLRDNHNIFLLYHHQWDKPLASTAIGTLQLSVDDVGLRFNATINKSISFANDVVQLMKQGLVTGCSFGFICNEEDIQYNSVDDSFTRTLLDVELFEGSLLCIPQYENTVAELSDSNNSECGCNCCDNCNCCNQDDCKNSNSCMKNMQGMNMNSTKAFARAKQIAVEERQKLEKAKDLEIRKRQIKTELELFELL